ncbi:unnamed protein product [Rotaria sordida]|uniref:Uncharacterized protein n=1 Tax=Rotaria sordida TaxID=392033 RepID=A0A819A3A1_9BILA|nr:unnamed protein product [Rotaria sordida]CAF3778266.1 unnamed protein product [Rotaria sordida]
MDDLDEEQRTLIPHSLRELTLHCIYKGFQLGSTVTLATALPYQLYKSRKNPSIIPILSRVGTATIYGAVGGVLLSIAMMHGKLYKEQYNQYKIWDRAYRLRNSASQNRVDKFTLSSSIMGGIAGLIIGLPTKMSPISATKGALMAIPFGILAHIIIKPLQNPSIETHKD